MPLINDDDEKNLTPVDDTEMPPVADNADSADDVMQMTDPNASVQDEIDAADQTQQDLAGQDEVAPPEDEVAAPQPTRGVKKHPYERYADMLGKYQELQDQKRKGNMMLGMLAGGQIAGQAIAGGRSGKFDTDLSNIKMLEDMNNSRVTDYTNAIKQQGMDISLKDMQQMRDPDSPVSQYYRSMAAKRGIPTDETMSAWDIQNMSKVLGKPNSATPRFRLLPLENKTTHEKQMGKFEQATGKLYSMDEKPLGPEWYQHNADRTILDTDGERKVFSSGLGQTIGPATGVGISRGMTPPTVTKGPDGADTFQINRTMLNGQQQKQLDSERKLFDADVKDERNAKNAALRIVDNLKNGRKIGDSPAEIMDQLSRAYGQKGHITDQQIGRAIGMADWKSRANAAISLASTGKLDEPNRQFLIKLANVIAQQNEQFIQAKSQVHVNNLYQDWSTSPGLSKYKIKPEHVANMLSVDQAAMMPGKVWIEGADTGRRLQVTKDQADKLIASKKFKQVAGPSSSPVPESPTQTAGPEKTDDEDEEQ
jgi:hypothetical protein